MVAEITDILTRQNYEKTWRDTIVGLEESVADHKKTIEALEEVIISDISRYKAQTARIEALEQRLFDIAVTLGKEVLPRNA